MYFQTFRMIPTIFEPSFKLIPSSFPEMVRICIIEVHMGFMIVLRLNKAFSEPDDTIVSSLVIFTATFPVRVPAA